MAKVENEIQQTIYNLYHIFWTNTDHDGITHKPFGLDWISLERNMHRLLVLRGIIKDGEIVQQDPWDMFTTEFAPKHTILSSSVKQPSQPYFPSSILLPASSGGQQNQKSSRVHFQSPLPGRSSMS
ncbi:hypothetical protein ASPWEDRAFT_37170 [Aspergillus wentii DTO 134E9]|uniref:Uncharacterized protein n=1 Tax=Aspergillus wentii DTO 134E9 TaxID=1073089 RepID=A0A1L9RWT6_ASPWE|nr:uncharacterized protein ASPWEDRAFT_37170 [Aspergillus wentii DTO 134E9]KAI9928925.1 hypothetical protein MW887_001318 [Aspergillus wentii]OJJ39392.1 hypothetical protein ASPWEDRAFT_37170 [Aspergillus wentii DTO 134E9]